MVASRILCSTVPWCISSSQSDGSSSGSAAWRGPVVERVPRGRVRTLPHIGIDQYNHRSSCPHQEERHQLLLQERSCEDRPCGLAQVVHQDQCRALEELYPVLQPIHHLRQLLVGRGQQILVNIPVV